MRCRLAFGGWAKLSVLLGRWRRRDRVAVAGPPSPTEGENILGDERSGLFSRVVALVGAGDDEVR